MDLTPNVDQMYQNPEPQKWHIFTPKFGVKIRVRIVQTVPPPPPSQILWVKLYHVHTLLCFAEGGLSPLSPKKIMMGLHYQTPPKSDVHRSRTMGVLFATE